MNKVLTVVAAACLAVPAATQDNELFGLLDKFGSLDTKDLPCVAIVMRKWDNEYRSYGFQTAHDGKVVEVVDLSLSRYSFEVAAKNRRGETRTIEPIALTDLIAIYKKKLARTDEHHFPSPATPMPKEAEAIVLARALARLGRGKESQELLEAIPNPTESMRIGLYYRMKFDRCDPRHSWQQLLDRYDDWIEFFGGNQAALKERETLANTVDKLAKGKFTAVQQALLNDVWLDGNKIMDAEAVEPPVPAPAEDERPIAAIDRLGLEAVLELIELLASDQPCRASIHSTRYGGYCRPIRMRAQASAALERLAGGPVAKPNESEMHAWIDWFAEAEQVGLDAMLERRVDELHLGAVKTFYRRFPDRIDRILKLLRTDKVHMGRSYYCIEWLLQQPELAKRDDVLDACAVAAGHANSHFQPHYWRQLDDAGHVAAKIPLAEHLAEQDVRKVPMSSGHESTNYRALLRRVIAHDAAICWQKILVTTNAEPGRYWLARELLARDGLAGAHKAISKGDDGKRAVIATLGRLLESNEILHLQHTVDERNRYDIDTNISVATVAAYALAKLWPDTFAFTWPRTDKAQQALLEELRPKFEKVRKLR